MDLKLVNVSKKIREKQILNNLSLNINEGECLGLVGPNGAGKTTLIRAILGLYSSEGDILFSSQKRDNIDISKNKILFILDTSGLLRNLDVRENIEFFYRIYNSSANPVERTRTIDSILEKIHLTEHSHKKIKELSRGMRQRLAIGRTMVTTPDLFIMDEPYLGLDVEAQIFLTDYIMELKSKGCTILISSHDLGHLEKICDRIAFLSMGNILKEEKCREIDSSLENAYKKLFIKG